MTTKTQSGLAYELTGSKQPKSKEGIRVISEMKTADIFKHLAVKHKFGLLLTYAIAITAYVFYTNIISLFS